MRAMPRLKARIKLERWIAGALMTGLAVPALVAAGPVAAASASETPIRLIVGFNPGASAAARDGILRGAGVTQHKSVYGLPFEAVTVPVSVASRLAAVPGVTLVEQDSQLRTAETLPNDPYYPQNAKYGGQWADVLTQAAKAWDMTVGSPQVVIAIIDTGVSVGHPDLAGQLVTGYNVLDGSTNTNDSNGHGTEAAGVAAASSNNGIGVAGNCWGCKIMPVKVLTSATANASDVASGITWAADHGARIISTSMAGSSSSTLTNAVSYARQRGSLVVAAAGNTACNCPSYPAAAPGAIGVAASDQTDTLYSYSDYGSWVTIAAPGQNTTTTLTDPLTGAPYGYAPIGGTSMATPVVAGIAGLLLSVNPTATPDQVTSTLMGTADPVNGVNQVASGRVNAYKAVTSFMGGTASTRPANTTPPTVTGTAQSGQILTGATGTWSGSPVSYAYQWQRCDSTGTPCAPVAGASAASFTAGSADIGFTLRLSVTATNAAGSSTATSAATAVVTVAPAAPVATSVPTVSGTAESGEALSASPGTWSGSPTSYGYQWQRCDSSGVACTALTGSTGSSYTATSADVGSTMRIAVTASNAAGVSTATSAPTSVVRAGTVTSSFSSSLTAKVTSRSFPVSMLAGSTAASLSFSRCSSMSLSLQAPNGSTVASASGPSVLNLNASVGTSGTYTYVVAGSCKVSFTLTATSTG